MIDTRLTDAQAVAAVVEKLRVRSGLRGEVRVLDQKNPLWRIGFYYDHDREGFTAVLYRGPRSSTMTLGKEHVETRGRSMWQADNTWRLTPAGVKAVVDSIMAVMADPRNTENPKAVQA